MTEGFTADQPNQVVEGKDIRGTLRVRAPGVVVRNCRITGDGDGVGIDVTDGGTAVIEDTEVSGFANGISHSNWTARRVDIHSLTADGVKLGSNVLLEDSWIHDLTPDSDAHADGGQVQSGIENTVVRNSAIVVGGANAALFISPSLGPSSKGPLLIENNYLEGGNFTIQVVDGNHGEYFIDDISVVGNSFGPEHRYGTHRVNVPVTWEGNSVSETGEELPLE